MKFLFISLSLILPISLVFLEIFTSMTHIIIFSIILGIIGFYLSPYMNNNTIITEDNNMKNNTKDTILLYEQSLIRYLKIIDITGFLFFVLGLSSIVLAIYSAINGEFIYLLYPIYLVVVISISTFIIQPKVLKSKKTSNPIPPEFLKAINGIVSTLATIVWLSYYFMN